MTTSTIDGIYGSNATPCNVLTAETINGTWYCIEGSCNVNFTFEEVESGVNVEMLTDEDYFSYNEGICTESELIEAIEA